MDKQKKLLYMLILRITVSKAMDIKCIDLNINETLIKK